MTAELKIHPHWLKPEAEESLMNRLHAIIAGNKHPDNGPFERNTGYKWQLDCSNNFWAEVRGDVLVLACRYDSDRTKTFVEFVKEWFQ
jgi:hypothetical protein